MKKLAYILSAVLLFSCGDEVAEKPKKLLPEDKMVDMLYDIALLQAINSYSPATLDSTKVDSRNYIYKKYSTDSLTFAQSNEYYASDLDLYEGMQKKVSEKIEKAKLKYGDKKQAVPKSGSSTLKVRPRTRTIKAPHTTLQVPSGKASSE